MKRITIAILILFGFCFTQDIGTEIRALGAKIQDAELALRTGKIGEVVLTQSQLEAQQAIKDNAKRLVAALVADVEIVADVETKADYSSVLIKIDNLIADAEARFYSRYDFRDLAIQYLTVAKDFIINGQPVDAVVELQNLLERSDRFYAATKDDTIKILQEMISALQI